MEFEEKLGVFSPDGRLIQVEYAQNATAQGNTIVFQSLKSSIRIAYENKTPNTLMVLLDRLVKIDYDRHFYMAFSGLKPDSLKIIQEAITICRNYKYSNDEDISLEKLARDIGKYKQKFTVSHSIRPLGLRSILLGIEKGIPRIYVIETDGNYSEYFKCALGYKSELSNKYLEENDDEHATLNALLKAVQTDTKKFKYFELTEKGLEEFEDEFIKSCYKE